MSWVVFLRPRAEADLEQARSRYEAERPGLGNEFLNQVSRVINRLAEHPE